MRRKMNKDEKYIIGLGGSNPNTFHKLYADYYEDICAYLLKYTTDKSKVEDAVQEAFVILWEKRKKITIKTSLKSYLYKLAYNKLMDSFRTQQKTNLFLSEYYHTVIQQVINNGEEEKLSKLQKLKSCLESLPKRCMEIFTANKISGMSYHQVAFEYKISIKTVEGHITSGYKLLRKCMQV